MIRFTNSFLISAQYIAVQSSTIIYGLAIYLMFSSTIIYMDWLFIWCFLSDLSSCSLSNLVICQVHQTIKYESSLFYFVSLFPLNATLLCMCIISRTISGTWLAFVPDRFVDKVFVSTIFIARPRTSKAITVVHMHSFSKFFWVLVRFPHLLWSDYCPQAFFFVLGIHNLNMTHR